ncbi:uncharacterized protein LOC115598059 [Calypte anna]|uniref:uncharacterized protein LOC115598059 n=1 Tax=Calypte anna TaxID=9244 RepID=UPI0011C49875|nr:uncharacterized protein LOC115598059 [Calypte anna]
MRSRARNATRGPRYRGWGSAPVTSCNRPRGERGVTTRRSGGGGELLSPQASSPSVGRAARARVLPERFSVCLRSLRGAERAGRLLPGAKERCGRWPSLTHALASQPCSDNGSPRLSQALLGAVSQPNGPPSRRPAAAWVGFCVAVAALPPQPKPRRLAVTRPFLLTGPRRVLASVVACLAGLDGSRDGSSSIRQPEPKLTCCIHCRRRGIAARRGCFFPMGEELRGGAQGWINRSCR